MENEDDSSLACLFLPSKVLLYICNWLFPFSVAFRCGLFFPNPRDDNAKPVAPLFVFNNSWSAPECPNGGDADRYSKFCTSIVSWRECL